LHPLAEQGDDSAQYNLGVMYEKGQGVLQDYEESVKWYRKAARKGVILATRR
jgi:TPR repeat protein